MSKPSRIREPVQVYLEAADKQLLDQLAERTALSRAELLRRGLRRLAAELNVDATPGQSLSTLIGALEVGDNVPTDLSARHDAYLYPNPDASPDADATGCD